MYISGVTDDRSTSINGNEIAKVALFGGDVDVTDEMWEEVVQYASFIKQKYNQ